MYHKVYYCGSMLPQFYIGLLSNVGELVNMVFTEQVLQVFRPGVNAILQLFPANPTYVLKLLTTCTYASSAKGKQTTILLDRDHVYSPNLSASS